jgi:hypothetical protein
LPHDTSYEEEGDKDPCRHPRLISYFAKMDAHITAANLQALISWDVPIDPSEFADFLKRIAIPPACKMNMNLLKEFYDRMEEDLVAA